MQYGANAEVADLGTALCPSRGDAWAVMGAEGRQQLPGAHQAGQSPLPHPAHSPQEPDGQRCWGFPASQLWAALALQGSSPSSWKPAR